MGTVAEGTVAVVAAEGIVVAGGTAVGATSTAASAERTWGSAGTSPPGHSHQKGWPPSAVGAAAS